MRCSVSLVDGHIDKDENWEQLDNRGTYYDGYRCRRCGSVIVVADYSELPCYCKECVKWL